MLYLTANQNRKAYKHAKLRKLTVCRINLIYNLNSDWNLISSFDIKTQKARSWTDDNPEKCWCIWITYMWQVFGQTHQSNAILSWDRNTDPSRPKIGPNSKIDSLFYNENWASGAKWNSSVLPHHKVFHFAPTTEHCGSRDYLGQGMHQGNHRVAGVSVKVQTTSKTSICKQDDILLTVIRWLKQYIYTFEWCNIAVCRVF